MTDLNPYEEGLALELQEAKSRIKALQKALKDQSSVSDRLAEQLATCEKYRDAYAECDRIGTQAVRDLEAKLAECEARLGKAVEALEPFAKAAETWEPDDGDSGLGARIEHPHHGLERHAEFTFGDLRRARATLAAVSETHKIKGESHDPL